MLNFKHVSGDKDTFQLYITEEELMRLDRTYIIFTSVHKCRLNVSRSFELYIKLFGFKTFRNKIIKAYQDYMLQT
jgi:hypothetical protein